jgi:cobalt/nickel transport system permease protein
LTYSQIALFKNTLNEFKLAFKSRALTKPDKKDLHNFIASSSYFFLNKALNSSEEMTQAMKSRGFFND